MAASTDPPMGLAAGEVSGSDAPPDQSLFEDLLGDHPNADAALGLVFAFVAQPPAYVTCNPGLIPAAMVAASESFTIPEEQTWDLMTEIAGPPDTPYEGGRFRLEVTLTAAFPKSPPRLRFANMLYHAQVSDSGTIDEAFYDETNLQWDQHSTIEDAVGLAWRMMITPLDAELGADMLLHAWCHKEFNVCIHTGAKPPIPWPPTGEDLETLLSDLREVFGDSLAETQRVNEAIAKERIRTAAAYRPIEPRLFATGLGVVSDPSSWPEEWFDATFYAAWKDGGVGDVLAILEPVVDNDVFTFPLFTEAFCQMLEDEVHAYEASGLPQDAPNSMNQYGLIVDNIGMDDMIACLLGHFLVPLGNALYPDCVGPRGLDAHHAFTVQYQPGKDIGLDMHTDDSEVTFNVALSSGFSGGGLTLCGLSPTPQLRKVSTVYEHVRGTCLVHMGRHRHGANDIEDGERNNLIIWCKSSSYRETDAFRDVNLRNLSTEETPDLVCLSRTHDPDFDAVVEYHRTAAAEAMGGDR